MYFWLHFQYEDFSGISYKSTEGYSQGNMTVLSSGRLGLLGAGPGYGGPAFLWTPAKFVAEKILLQNLEL